MTAPRHVQAHGAPGERHGPGRRTAPRRAGWWCGRGCRAAPRGRDRRAARPVRCPATTAPARPRRARWGGRPSATRPGRPSSGRRARWARRRSGRRGRRGRRRRRRGRRRRCRSSPGSGSGAAPPRGRRRGPRDRGRRGACAGPRADRPRPGRGSWPCLRGGRGPRPAAASARSGSSRYGSGTALSPTLSCCVDRTTLRHLTRTPPGHATQDSAPRPAVPRVFAVEPLPDGPARRFTPSAARQRRCPPAPVAARP